MKNFVRQWDLETISNIMMACIIMHNMTIFVIMRQNDHFETFVLLFHQLF